MRSIQVGNIKQGTVYKTNYPFSPGKKVTSITPSCGCMDSTYNKSEETIKFTYRAARLPRIVLENKGYSEISKFLTVTYEDNTSERINIIGKIIQ